jgi:acetyl-CoA acetyltransferase
LGCHNQAGEDNRNVARMALLLAGLPYTIAGETVNRLCASGMSAVINASRAIQTGDADVMIAGGMEHMTRGVGLFQKHQNLLEMTPKCLIRALVGVLSIH